MTIQVYRDPVQLYVMPRNRALNIERLEVGRTPLKVADGNALLLSIIAKAEELSVEVTGWCPELLAPFIAGMTKEEADEETKKHKQWAPSALRQLISSNPDRTYSLVVFTGEFGPRPAILADNPEFAGRLKKEVIDL